jgi:hypothetical protein
MGEEKTACEMTVGACDRCGRCGASETPEQASIVKPDQVESSYINDLDRGD